VIEIIDLSFIVCMFGQFFLPAGRRFAEEVRGKVIK
jgi:hypothetical protein